MVAGASYSRRQFGFLWSGAYAGGFSLSVPTAEALHAQHYAISNLHLVAGERNDVAGERNDVLNPHLAGAEEYEYEAVIEGAEEEVEKEVEDDGDMFLTVQGDYSPAALRGIRQQRLAGAARFRNPPFGLPKLHLLPWSSEQVRRGVLSFPPTRCFSLSHQLVILGFLL